MDAITQHHILTAKAKDLFKIRATLISVVEDMAEEIKDRANDLEDAYFPDLGGPVVSRVDMMTLVDAVVKDIVHIIEKASDDAVEAAHG